jgi:hypothetical protein
MLLSWPEQESKKLPLGTDLGSASPASIITLTISGGNKKLTLDQQLGATSPYTSPPTSPALIPHHL